MDIEQKGHECALEEFRTLLTRARLEGPPIYVDGAIHRFGEKRSAWYVLEDDGAAIYGCYGDWRDHDDANGWNYFEHVYGAAGSVDVEEAARLRREQCKAAYTQHQGEVRAAARARARELWDVAEEVPGDHPYLSRKGVGSHGIRAVQEPVGGLEPPLLVIPFYAVDKTLHTLQFIDITGQKRWLSGGAKGGRYFRLPGKDDCLFVAEGFATAASIQEVTGRSVVMAGDKGNLAPVAAAICSRLPDLEIVIAADIDAVASAEVAARAVGARIAVPAFPADVEGTDFNDLVQAIGAAETAQQLLEDTGPDIWPEPAPLPDDLPPVPTFTPELLPGVLHDWITDIAERMQCPMDYPAVSAMTALGAIVGRQLAIRPKRYDSWTVVPNLWAMVIGRPGVMKTNAIKHPLLPIEILEARARERYEEEMQQFKLDAVAAQVAGKEAKEELRKKTRETFDTSGTFSYGASMNEELRRALLDDGTAEPVLRRYRTSDATVEKLGELLAHNPRGLLLFRDELAGLLAKLDREDRGSDRAFYLEAWNGDGGFTYDRIGRGTLEIEACCLSVLGGIQPRKLHSYLSSGARGGMDDDGLIQRFQLAVWPDITTGWKNIDRAPDALASARATALFESLDELDATALGAHRDDDTSLPYLRFMGPAQEVFDEWRADLEARLRSGDEHAVMESHLAKYRSLVPSLALLLHLASGERGPVGEEALLMACAWVEYLEAHARRILSAAISPDVLAARELLKRVRSDALPDSFRLRDVYRNHWHLLASQEEAQKAARVLEEFDYLMAGTETTGGRSTVRYQVNPKAKSRP